MSLDLNKTELVTALEENLWGLWKGFGRGPDSTLHERRDAVWFDTPITQLPYNGMPKFAVYDDPDAVINEIFQHYRERGVPFFWLIHPSSKPEDLAARLNCRGFQEAERLPGMTMDLGLLPPREVARSDYEIREFRAEEELDALLELVAWRWEIAPDVAGHLRGLVSTFNVGKPGAQVRCWGAMQNGVPVSKIVLNLHSGSAGIYGVATKPGARGQGLAKVLVLEALHTAREEGFQLGVLHSSPLAQPLYERIGFRPTADFSLFADAGSFHV